MRMASLIATPNGIALRLPPSNAHLLPTCFASCFLSSSLCSAIHFPCKPTDMAGAVVGGGTLLSASLKALFDRMASRDVLTFLRGHKLSDTLLRKLKMKLLAVKAVLNDAEARQITDSDVNDWVDELRDAVYDAEYLLDDITNEALRCEMESDSQTRVWNINFCVGIKSRVEEITGTLEYLAEKKRCSRVERRPCRKFVKQMADHFVGG